MLKTLSLAAMAWVLGGCAAFNNLASDVSSYGPWPAERKPASFVFERLPSQQASRVARSNSKPPRAARSRPRAFAPPPT